MAGKEPDSLFEEILNFFRVAEVMLPTGPAMKVIIVIMYEGKGGENSKQMQLKIQDDIITFKNWQLQPINMKSRKRRFPRTEMMEPLP